MIADGFSPIADVFLTLLVVAVSAVLIVSYAAAAVGARQGRPSAVFCGCLVGVAAAMLTGWALLYYADSLAGALLGPLVGGAMAYGIARRKTSGTT